MHQLPINRVKIVDVADISLTLPDAADADQEDRQIGHQEGEQDLCAALLSPTASLISETFTTPEQVTDRVWNSFDRVELSSVLINS